MAIAKKSLMEFIALTAITRNNKERWHRLGHSLARTLAIKLGMPKGTFSTLSCRGGPAPGEIILYSDWLYIRFGVSCFGGAVEFMYRTHGGINRFMDFAELLDLDKVAEKLLECKGEV